MKAACLSALLFLSSCAILTADPPSPPPGKVWTSTLSDDFSGALNASTWQVGYGWGRTRNDTEEYIHDENVTVADGLLKLHVTKVGTQVRAGAVHSKNRFTQRFGYYEARIRFLDGPGTLQAFWFKSNNEEWPPECDVCELAPYGGTAWGWGKQQYHHNLFYKENGIGSTNNTSFFENTGIDLTKEFHTFGVWWDEQSFRFYFDNQLVESFYLRRVMDAFNHNGEHMYLMLSVHVEYDENSDDDWFARADGDTWGKTMDVDWVRVWSLVDESMQVEQPHDAPVNKTFELYPAYPNPFNASTTFSYQIWKPAQLSVDILNTRGQFIRSLITGPQQAGMHRFVWDGKNQLGSEVDSGVYFIRFRVLDDRITTHIQKVLLIK